uniref:Centromere protein P n=2 Tax=Sus scrofa TaxID=9823 RepID=A0A8D1XY09_PIG
MHTRKLKTFEECKTPLHRVSQLFSNTWDSVSGPPDFSNLFFSLQEKYPETVHLAKGASSSYMGIRSHSRPEFELVIVWRIQIDEEGKVLPRLDLLTKAPLSALELDKNRVIETAPLSFRTLLGVLGIEATLESLIKSLCTEK